MKRLFDIVCALGGLVAAAPILAAAAVGIRLSGRGPIFYRARRSGRGGAPFTMYKLRTMRVALPGEGSRITGGNDPRIFPFGAFLRRLKVDELPQLFNILKGEMSLVGPRPEDPEIVAAYYTPAQRETLEVPPGLTSPGSLYYYTHCEHAVAADDPEASYLRFLPLKLALDRVYVRHASFFYDLQLVVRTVFVVAALALGKKKFAVPSEMEDARGLLVAEDDSARAEEKRAESDGESAANDSPPAGKELRGSGFAAQ